MILPSRPPTQLRQRVVIALIGMAGVTMLATVALIGMPVPDEEGPVRLTDGDRYGPWRAVFDGYGQTTAHVEGADLVITLAPRAATGPGSTHAGLVVSTEQYSDVRLSAQVRTVRQLRSPQPAPWEVGWVLWGYRDQSRFYAFALKPNGWELSKQDPAYRGGQRFLASGASPRVSVGSWHTVDVIMRDETISVAVDGVPAVTTRDTDHPYTSGAVGLYCEDAVVEFRRVDARQMRPTDLLSG